MKKRPSWFVSILVCFFGLGTWLCVNGLWVELPLLVQVLPESWTLPSYMAVIIQVANLGPILYTILHSYFPSLVTEKRAIYFVMGLALVALLLLVQYWMKVLSIFGVDHSVAFLTLVFILAAVDCSSRVMYLPFMSKFKPEYLTYFFIGEGLSGFVPSIFAVIQGAGGNPECIAVNSTNSSSTEEDEDVIWTKSHPNPLFSIEIFLYLMFITTILSGIAFYLLNQTSIVGKCLASQKEQSSSKSNTDVEEVKDILLSNYENNQRRSYDSTLEKDNPQNVPVLVPPVMISNSSNIEEVPVTKNEEISLMILLIIISSLGNGVFPSIQSYSCLPYGNSVYHWAVTLSSMANPGVCFLMLCFLKQPTKLGLIVGSILSLGFGGYIMYTAIQSPVPSFLEEWWSSSFNGQLLLVSSWILVVGLFTYVKVSIATIMRSLGKRGLFYTGVFTQFGSSLGAIVAFGVVNFTSVFQSYDPCQ